MTTKKNKASDSRLQTSGRISKTKSRSPKPAPRSQLPEARLNAAIADINEAVDRLQTSGGRGMTALPSNPEVQSPKGSIATGNQSEARPKVGPDPLPAPVLGILSASNNTVIVNWNAVNNASGYKIELANNPTFADPLTLNADAAATSWNVTGLEANTTYFIRVMTTGTGANGNSAFSNVQSIRTLSDGSITVDDLADGLQHWLDNLQTITQGFSAAIPQLENTVLSSAERRRLLGSGVRRYGYIDKVSDTAEAYPQFWPAFQEPEKLKDLIREIEVLRNLLIYFESGSRTVLDLLLTVGNNAFRLANMYYASVRTAARQQVPDAEAVFDMLRLFWKRRRRITDEPTEHEVERDVRALIRGNKDGEIIVRNESDSIVKGAKVLIDNTYSNKQRGGIKVIERGEIKDQSTE